jgi:hypothetical protein
VGNRRRKKRRRGDHYDDRKRLLVNLTKGFETIDTHLRSNEVGSWHGTAQAMIHSALRENGADWDLQSCWW